MIVISDTSPISGLIKINRLDLLQKVFLQIIVPEKVHSEILDLIHHNIDLREYTNSNWIEVRSVYDKAACEILAKRIDEGEAEAIILAKELNANIILIDEREGAMEAIKLGLNTIGLLGVLL